MKRNELSVQDKLDMAEAIIRRMQQRPLPERNKALVDEYLEDALDGLCAAVDLFAGDRSKG